MSIKKPELQEQQSGEAGSLELSCWRSCWVIWGLRCSSGCDLSSKGWGLEFSKYWEGAVKRLLRWGCGCEGRIESVVCSHPNPAPLPLLGSPKYYFILPMFSFTLFRWGCFLGLKTSFLPNCVQNSVTALLWELECFCWLGIEIKIPVSINRTPGIIAVPTGLFHAPQCSSARYIQAENYSPWTTKPKHAFIN